MLFQKSCRKQRSWCSLVPEDDYIFKAIRAGANSYISKDVSAEELIRSVLSVNQGEIIVSPPMAVRLSEELTRINELLSGVGEKNRHALSGRESEILGLVSKGLTNREIANILFISENTAKGHMSRILEKLHFHNRQQAIAWAIQRGIKKDFDNESNKSADNVTH